MNGSSSLGPPAPAPSADILLTHAYFLGEDVHERKYMKPFVPLGILYLSAYLKRAGFGVAVLDTTFADRAGLEACLAARPAPVLGIYTNLITRPSVLAITRRAKALGYTVVLGGPESANYPAEYLAAGADVVVFGEGEAALAELLPALSTVGPQRLHAVLGIAFRDGEGQVVRTPARPKLDDLGALPWPDRAAVDIDAYLALWRRHHGHGALNLITARGCPYRCTWCSHAVFGYHHARRPPEDVADEVAFLRERYAPDRLWFADDVFSINKRWLRAYAERVRARGLALPFECITRADRVDAEVVALMAELGCDKVWLGSESGSQRVLDAMQRGVTVAEVQAATGLFKRAGIEVGMFLMWGYDGEEDSDIAATIEHVKRADPDVFLTTVAYPIQGTPYFDAVVDRVTATRPWAEASDRDHVVAGRHSRRYYGFATQRLKSEVALHRLLNRHARPPVWPVIQAAVGTARGRLGMRLTARETERA